MKKHVLIVDDDASIVAMVAYLAKEDPLVRTSQVNTGQELHAILKGDSVDLLVLDLGLPDENGLALARQIRARSTVPILVLTADDTRDSLIAALEIGVNDFMTKPFDPYELRLRIKNLLRHASGTHPASDRIDARRLNIGPWVLDLNQRQLTAQDGSPVHLTNNEFNLLSSLAARPNMALSRSVLLDTLANGDDAPTARAIDVYITQIRRKIEADPKHPVLIQTIRGFGYMLIKQGA